MSVGFLVRMFKPDVPVIYKHLRGDTINTTTGALLKDATPVYDWYISKECVVVIKVKGSKHE